MGVRQWVLAWAIAVMAGQVHAELEGRPTCEAIREQVKAAAIEKKVSLADVARAVSSLDSPDQRVFTALLHLCGIGVAQDLSQGLALLQKEISSGDRGATAIIALAYMNGELGLPKDVRKGKQMFIQFSDIQQIDGVSVRPGDISRHREHFPDIAATEEAWLLKAAFNGDRAALTERALAEYDAGSYVSALPLLRVAAAAGDYRAYDRLIWMYQTGTGVVADEKEAFLWAQRGVSTGSSIAYERMGGLIAHFRGGRKAALDWAQQLADAGDAGAMNYLGLMHDGGDGRVPANQGVAEKWWKAAAAKGYGPAEDNLNRLATRNSWRTESNRELSAAREATHSATASALLALARITNSREERHSSYRKAIELGSETAVLEYGSLLVYYGSTDQDRAEGLRIMHEAAAQGNKKAMAWLSRNYAEGGFVVQDLPLAFALNFLAYADSPDSADELARYQASLPVTLTSPQLAQGRRLATELREPGRFTLVLQTHLAR